VLGSCAQPAASTITARMWVVILEMSLALALAAFIVWWTWPGKGGRDDKDQ